MYEIMTAGQVAQYLQLDEQTIYRKVKRGEIPAVRIGKTLRFKKDLIDGWLQLSSLQWNGPKRRNLRGWAEGFAKTKGLSEEDVLVAVARRRKKGK
jgi:excisionase family DNA binding protein